ncbi:hypothetical protein DFA_08944 [Cavenderia fasciculata]|uniref:Uncharacterized protein n=1 Tax=Cavenderia fasciculata TaxID=261658 RepID=F4Q550_CACFS|nr:uncharacterized protein DFA_08944 [Cavenderia fasciculata]EGG17943.1 hypothetical protein DFA_08944 [Cavenderia fasciculata]|eukprot:XP_004356427.1 hypothetical protein DFA_08944 [Cavenderia fasciculata]
MLRFNRLIKSGSLQSIKMTLTPSSSSMSSTLSSYNNKQHYSYSYSTSTTPTNDPKGHKKTRDQMVEERNQAMDIVGNKTIDDVEKELGQSEKKLHDTKGQRQRLEEKKAKTKKDILTVLGLAALASLVFIRDYIKRKDQKKQFDEEWENLRVLINERDALTLKKKEIIALITSHLLKQNPSLSAEELNQSVDNTITKILTNQEDIKSINQSISNENNNNNNNNSNNNNSQSSTNEKRVYSGRI